MRARAALALAASALAFAAPGASAAGPPLLGAAWSFSVGSASARLGAQVDPNGSFTSYRFDYLTEAAYEANLGGGKDPFTGALKSPPVADANLGEGTGLQAVQRQLFGLAPDTPYRYRVVATSSAGPSTGVAHSFATQALGGGALLPDNRGWEMVSPLDKNGGQVDPPGSIAGGAVAQAAAAGGSVTYSSRASFGPGAGGAPPASQYVATRSAGGWATQNITAPIFSATYGTEDQGVPYQLFAPDLSRALLLNGEHCRGEAGGCAVANPPLAGTEAPAGYQDYYLREGATGAFAALLGSSDIAGLDLDPATFDLRLAGASADLRHVVLSSCAALTPDATEVALGAGCDPAQPNLYEWSGGGLSLANILPAQSSGAPGAALAAQAGAVSEDGARLYWQGLATGSLYLREGAQTRPVQGGGAAFEAAAADGATALYTKANHLYRYDAATQTSTDLTPAGGVVGVLGASADAASVYYQDAGALRLWHGGTTTTVAGAAEAAAPSDYPPATGSARVSADGTRLLFVSSAPLTGFDNTDLNTGSPDSEVYLYDATAATPLACVSCNPTNERPIGPSWIPGAVANGTAPGSTDSYKPRVLAADGRRVFFDSGDALALADTNSGAPDAYQWEAPGEGSCAKAGGCTALISSGRNAAGASFLDASEDGADAFFLTEDSLVGADPGALDLYDARIGGGFPEPPAPIPCEGDACQALPSAPLDPTLTTLLAGPGNPAVRYRRYRHGRHHRKGRHRGGRRSGGGR